MNVDKVMCPWCGNEMELYEEYRYEFCGYSPYKAYRCAECGAESPTVGVKDDAYLAATRRPPNPPLTKEQIMGMDDLDAVWLSFADTEETKNALALDGAFGWKIKLLDMALPVDPLFFSVRPTPADIEAARKKG